MNTKLLDDIDEKLRKSDPKYVEMMDKMETAVAINAASMSPDELDMLHNLTLAFTAFFHKHPGVFPTDILMFSIQLAKQLWEHENPGEQCPSIFLREMCINADDVDDSNKEEIDISKLN